MDLERHLFALQLAYGFLQHPDIHIEPDGVNVPVLLASQQIAGAAQLQIERGNLEPCAQFAELFHGRKPLASSFGKLRIGLHQQVRVRAPVRAADASAQLVKVRQAVPIRIFNDHGVG